MKYRLVLVIAALFLSGFFLPVLGDSTSPRLIIRGAMKKPLDISSRELAKLPQLAAHLNEVTQDGKYRSGHTHIGVPLRTVLDLAIGWHGMKKFSGVPLAAVLERAGAEKTAGGVCIVSAPDGYRSLLSFGESFCRRQAPASSSPIDRPANRSPKADASCC